MERRLDELHRHLQQHGHAQAARADARDRQPAPHVHWVNNEFISSHLDRSNPGLISKRERERERETGSCTYPTIQMMAPMKETTTARSAKGRPSSHPIGRQSPPQQHIPLSSYFNSLLLLLQFPLPRLLWRVETEAESQGIYEADDDDDDENHHAVSASRGVAFRQRERSRRLSSRQTHPSAAAKCRTVVGDLGPGLR